MSVFPARILLSKDGSEDAELAMTTAVGLTRSPTRNCALSPSFRSQLTCTLTTPPVVSKGSSDTSEEPGWVLDAQVKKIAGPGTTVAGARLRTGEVAEEVVKLADELGAGLIAVGSRGRGKKRRRREKT